MERPVCMVTGANGALGRAIALGLARRGAHVLMVCRDRARGQEALNHVLAHGHNPSLELLIADLSSMVSVRKLAEQVREHHGHLDVLVNNAAVLKGFRTLTVEGLETMFATNHLGPFLLTNLLLEPLSMSRSARVLNVAPPSTTPVPFDDLQAERKFACLEIFAATKMCNLLFTYELARRLAGTTITANAVHPGLVRSHLLAEAPRPIRLFSHLVSRAPEKAADAPVRLALDPELEGITGRFFRGRKPANTHPYSHVSEHQRRLWETSERLVGLS